VWDFLLKFSTEMLIRTMNGTLTHNVEALAKKGIWNTNVQPLHQSFIVVQMFNLPRQPLFCQCNVSGCRF